MSIEPAGLLLTLAAVIALRLADGVAYRRRVRARLRALIATLELTRRSVKMARKSPPVEALTFTPAGWVR